MDRVSLRRTVTCSDVDSRDFLNIHPVPQPPEPEKPRDVPWDTFSETAQAHAGATPISGRRSMGLVDPTVCRYDPQNPCDHNHSSPQFRPQPELDEIGVGWTVQHIPKDRTAHVVAQRCILCSEEHSDLREHDCQVMAVVNG